MATGSLLHEHGKWMPEDLKLRQYWLASLIDRTDRTIPPVLAGEANPVDEFKKLIEDDPTLYMLANSMFEEVPTKPPYDKDPTTRKKQVRSYKTMLYLFNTLLTQVPEWFGGEDENGNDVPTGLIGFPFNIILDWPMGTLSGRQFFLDPRVNECIKKCLNKWGEFLKDPKAGTASDTKGNELLQEAGWTKPQAIKQLEKKAKEAMPAGASTDKLTFKDLFEFPSGGEPSNFFNYSCWDKFFTRKFQNNIRPIDSSGVVNACESFPLAFDTDVSRRSTFWLKGTPYSLRDMLGASQDSANEELAGYVEKFVGGTIYQAFLSADSYHCWNAPVTGNVKYEKVLDGTYYAETAAAGFGGSSGPDPAGPDVSQRYITHIAARGVLIIDTDVTGGANIGLVGFVPVGMSEVSTCDFSEKVKSKGTIEKGEYIGCFHSGGSTHCLIFERQAMEKLDFSPKVQYPDMASANLAVCSKVACVKPPPPHA